MPPLPIDSQHPDLKLIDRTVELLRRGELVVIPTETVYGLAGDTELPGVEKAIYRAKGREFNKPLALFCRNIDQAEAHGATVTSAARALAERFWPGPLTLVLPDGAVFTGFRVPDHPVPLALLEKLGRVIAVTSANRSNQPDATTAPEAEAALGESVALVLDAGPSPGGLASTVVQMDPEGVKILRAGAISEEDILTTIEQIGD